MLELPAIEQALELAPAPAQDPFAENHRQRRPAGPHLEREAPPPAAEVAPVLEILVPEARLVEELSRLLRKRVLPHADYHDLIRRQRVLHLLHDVGTVAGHLCARLRMDLRFVQDAAGHGDILSILRRLEDLQPLVPLCSPHARSPAHNRCTGHRAYDNDYCFISFCAISQEETCFSDSSF